MAAANGDTVQVGHDHEGGTETSFKNTTAGLAALSGEASGGGSGVRGVGRSAVGVQGRGSGIAGIGVQGIGGGIGVQATTTSGGFGLDVDNGRIRIGQVAGVATIPRGRTRVLVSPRVDVNARTFVVLTPQANIGARALWPTKLVGKNKLFIRMSSRRTVRTRVAWLALEHGLRVGLDPVQTEIPQWWGFRAG